jgi:MoaA/NifB/PqqE/SkfB family radical SAM enzyme
MKSGPYYIIRKILKAPVRALPGKVAQGIRHYVLNIPDHITLQTVSACNLKCRHCFINNFGREIEDGKKRILTLDEFKKRADAIARAVKMARFFQFSSFEALMHTDLFRMMDYVLEINPKIQFPILTNAMLPDDYPLEKLLEYPLIEFTVSLDGVCKETVESFKTGACFDKIVSVVKRISTLSPKIALNTVFVLHRNNANELVAYMDFVKGLGVKTVFVNNLLSFTEEMKTWVLYTPHGNPEIEKLFKEAVNRAVTNSQTLWLPAMKPRLLGCEQCEMLFIDPDGNVAPCDFLSVSTPFEMFGRTRQGKPVVFGNIFRQDVLTIYRSKRFKAFRQGHRSGRDVPVCCECCIDAYGLICSRRTRHGPGS